MWNGLFVFLHVAVCVLLVGRRKRKVLPVVHSAGGIVRAIENVSILLSMTVLITL